MQARAWLNALRDAPRKKPLPVLSLKSVLSLPEIDSTLRGLTAPQPIGDLYQDFADA